jgi:hypothetical protein
VTALAEVVTRLGAGHERRTERGRKDRELAISQYTRGALPNKSHTAE